VIFVGDGVVQLCRQAESISIVDSVPERAVVLECWPWPDKCIEVHERSVEEMVEMPKLSERTCQLRFGRLGVIFGSLECEVSIFCFKLADLLAAVGDCLLCFLKGLSEEHQ
jgi:hypothetical protein